ncbi:MAG: hypothetical protein ACYTEW_20890 [Planctomycetota bacterium]
MIYPKDLPSAIRQILLGYKTKVVPTPETAHLRRRYQDRSKYVPRPMVPAEQFHMRAE